MKSQIAAATSCITILMVISQSALAVISGTTTITFEEGINGTIVSATDSNITEYEESGLTVTAINPPDHFHLFDDDIQIFGSDSSGATFTATDGKPLVTG